jgi:diguanylate cyclase (GGDEF)-like protein
MQLHLDISSAARGAQDLLALFVDRVRHVLAVDAAIAFKHRGHWMFPVAAPTEIAGAEAVISGMFDRLVADAGALRADVLTIGERDWTGAAVGASPASVLLLDGDWTRSVGALSLLVGDLSLLRRAATSAATARSLLAAHRLARTVASSHRVDALADIIVRAMAEAVHARIGALACPSDANADLEIVATYGYRRELVEHLRLRSGDGILGSVFRSGRPVLARSGDDFAHGRSRARYRTKSFIAVPIQLGRQTLAVASVTDRRDDGTFSKDDVSTLRALAAPSALALARGLAVAEAEAFAKTAAIDPGSGVFNRRYLQTRIDEEIQRSRRHGAPVSLLMLDLDNFKSINDSFGHLAGDAVIKDVAQILRRSVRIFDVCARFGGEEFAILMPGASIESATKIAARIRERIEAYRCADPPLTTLRVTASLGLAVSFPEISSQDLVARADDALYLAKREGKNRLRVLGPDVPATHIGTVIHRP